MKHEVIYMTAEQLGLTDAEYEGLLRIKGELERGELQHVTDVEFWPGSRGFNMGSPCGTVQCIGGWMKERGQLRGSLSVPECEKLRPLFWPYELEAVKDDLDKAWDAITPAQAARAIGNFLATGEPRWAECVA